MVEIIRQVNAGTDDAWRRLVTSLLSLTYTDLTAGSNTATRYKYGCGMRFTNITIAPGSTITLAYLTLNAFTGFDGTVVRTRISAEKIDDAPTFADNAAAFDARWANRTTGRMDWDNIGAWVEDSDYNSPTTDGSTTFASIIQEIIDRPGWESGFDIVIFWDDFEDRSDREGTRRSAHSFEGSAEFAPKLVIQYTPPVVGWTGKISGVTNPAKIMGVDVANIAKVKGVA